MFHEARGCGDKGAMRAAVYCCKVPAREEGSMPGARGEVTAGMVEEDDAGKTGSWWVDAGVGMPLQKGTKGSGSEGEKCSPIREGNGGRGREAGTGSSSLGGGSADDIAVQDAYMELDPKSPGTERGGANSTRTPLQEVTAGVGKRGLRCPGEQWKLKRQLLPRSASPGYWATETTRNHPSGW
ncbi:hypothetical protein AMTR_s00004p00096600 [Amborella trichopoda]|uniref:Uncharacterized protein n=1 Tax=Amborella trichopoda TaxID=13333 RepID=W1NDI0_AMBTC|nr:hypothetical protein AMTR_s00004p00096600 [Amborella trichopoda]